MGSFEVFEVSRTIIWYFWIFWRFFCHVNLTLKFLDSSEGVTSFKIVWKSIWSFWNLLRFLKSTSSISALTVFSYFNDSLSLSPPLFFSFTSSSEVSWTTHPPLPLHTSTPATLTPLIWGWFFEKIKLFAPLKTLIKTFQCLPHLLDSCSVELSLRFSRFFTKSLSRHPFLLC